MKPAYSQHPISYPTSWSELAYGDWAREKIQAQLDAWLPKLFGYHLLKLGGLSCELMSQNCHITHQVAIDRANSYRTISAENSALPFVDKAFDVCLVANQLDYTKAAHHLLQEIDRVIIDDGYLIISGFNPFGLLGLGRFIPGNNAHFPWNGRMFTSARVQDWLSVLSYQVIDARTFGLFPARESSLLFENIENLAGCASMFGSIYFIVARKRTCPVRPLVVSWGRRRTFPALGMNGYPRVDK